MNHLRELIYRLRAGESQRRIAKDLSMSRTTVSKYRRWAKAQGYLDAKHPLPDDATLAAALGEPLPPPRAESSVEPYREIVQAWVEQGVEMVAVWQHLQDDYRLRFPSRSLGGQPPLMAYPEAEHSGRPYRLEWEEAMLDMQQVYDYLAQGRWFRRTSSQGQFSLRIDMPFGGRGARDSHSRPRAD